MIDFIGIDKIKPAEYNPRKISEEQKAKLRESIQELGFVMPVIVNKANNVIIAGHQRTNAAIQLCLEAVPVQFVENLDIGDEIRFNQLHNANATNPSSAKYIGKPFEGYAEKPADEFRPITSNAESVKQLCIMMLKYGNVFSCVVEGESVICGGDYVKACSLLGKPVTAYGLQKKDVQGYLNKEYGVYSYDSLKRNTYVQGLAQLYRDPERQKQGKKPYSSMLYETMVLPYLQNKPQLSVLDFGCGKGGYISQLAKHRRAVGIEFFNNNGSVIDVAAGNAMIDRLCKEIEINGPFDVVVCDSVMNSVDSLQAEKSVMGCLNLFGTGKCFISGRPRDRAEDKLRSKRSITLSKRFSEFMDADGFTATYRKGNWYYQHYQTKEQVQDLAKQNGFVIDTMAWGKHGDSYQTAMHKTMQLSDDDLIAALSFEFDLPLPSSRSYGRQADIIAACRRAGLLHSDGQTANYDTCRTP